ncbi:MAG: hypothetical protein ACLRXC_07950 [[Clostridium] leptum]
MAANVSVNRMDFQLDGRRRTYLQLGTVMTHPDYRAAWDCPLLMEWILQNWSDRCDGIYLFANDTVLVLSQVWIPPSRGGTGFPSSPQQPIPLRRINLTTPKTGRF